MFRVAPRSVAAWFVFNRRLKSFSVASRSILSMSEEKLTLIEAAKELRIRPRALRDMCKAGRIGFVRAGHRHWLFTRSDINSFLERNTFRPKEVFHNKPANR